MQAETQAPTVPQTGKLRDLFAVALANYAATGSEQALADARWANRMLKRAYQEREARQAEESEASNG